MFQIFLHEAVAYSFIFSSDKGKEREVHTGDDSDSDEEELDQEASNNESEFDDAENVVGSHTCKVLTMVETAPKDDSLVSKKLADGSGIGATPTDIQAEVRSWKFDKSLKLTKLVLESLVS